MFIDGQVKVVGSGFNARVYIFPLEPDSAIPLQRDNPISDRLACLDGYHVRIWGEYVTNEVSLTPEFKPIGPMPPGAGPDFYSSSIDFEVKWGENTEPPHGRLVVGPIRQISPGDWAIQNLQRVSGVTYPLINVPPDLQKTDGRWWILELIDAGNKEYKVVSWMVYL
jgi:hypothetical protein